MELGYKNYNFFITLFLKVQRAWASEAGAERGRALWIFTHGADKAERSLMVLLFGLVFFRCPSSLEIFLPTPLAARSLYA